jgi:heme A synthase
VTSNDAALSVPDWPLSLGRLVPPLEGGIRYEFAHRVLAALVALLIGAQACWLHARESRPWMRKLAWWALAVVLAEAALGGAVVKLVDPKVLAVGHACLGQLCFALTVAVAAGHYQPAAAGKRLAPILAVVVVFAETILGAAVRHNAAGLEYHIAGAAVAVAVVMWATMGVLTHHMEDAAMRRPAVILLTLTGAQLFSGLTAYAARVVTSDAPQPMPLMIWATVTHVTTGALVFGAAIVLAMTYRRG